MALAALVIGFVMVRAGQAPSPNEDGQLWLVIPGLLLVLAACVRLVVLERQRRRG